MVSLWVGGVSPVQSADARGVLGWVKRHARVAQSTANRSNVESWPRCDVGSDRVREENRCKEGNNALFAVDSRRAQGQMDVRKYPWDSVDREIGV